MAIDTKRGMHHVGLATRRDAFDDFVAHQLADAIARLVDPDGAHLGQGGAALAAIHRLKSTAGERRGGQQRQAERLSPRPRH